MSAAQALDFRCPGTEATEQEQLVNAVTLFIENYRLMHAGTLYSLQVEEAARRVRAKLLEV